jgi:transcriptional regulator with XRE-family HTH domain
MAAKIELFYADVGQRVRALRTKLGLTQEQLGGALSPPTTRVSIANVESGRQRVLTHTLVQLAAALKVEPSDLLPAKVEPSSNDNDNDHAIAAELVSKAGLSKTSAKMFVEKPQALKTWKEK